MVESERLSYIRNNQPQLRSDKYKNLAAAVSRGETDPSSTGQRIFMPSSFMGGARYMMQNYQDAMAICKYYGYPDLFITITCNPKWPEIERFLDQRGLKTEDRPDIICRIFKIKLDQIIRDMKEEKLLGEIRAVIYTVEFQKRGLPHAHILIFLQRDNKIPTPDDVDNIISAEIPDKEKNLKLYELVSSHMLHGPCSASNSTKACMKNGKCSKRFPKKYMERTTVDEDGYPLYKRRDSGSTVIKNGVTLDNRYVVPYSPLLLMRYQAHINVEWFNQFRSIKYLFKYINKGHDRVTASITMGNDADVSGEQPVDEIKNFYNYRYISPCKAVWRLFAFDIYYRNPSVQRLSFHLPDEQPVVFKDGDFIDTVLDRQGNRRSMFVAWMDCNKKYAEGRSLTYVEFPTKFVWKHEDRVWELRKQGFSVGRLDYVPPGAGELHYLSIMLHHSRGAISYEHIRTVNSVIHTTFKDACYTLGLLDDDKEYIDGIIEVSFWGSPHFLRKLFASLLLSASVSRPEYMWEKTWSILAEDILPRQRRLIGIEDLHLTDDQLKTYALVEIEKLLQHNGRSIKDFVGMPVPSDILVVEGNNKLIQQELNYDRSILEAEHRALCLTLTDEQKSIYEEILGAALNDRGGIFFVYGYGGTGKTYIWRTLSAALRSRGEIVLNVASSGVAALLLPSGRTAHSRFGIPINISEKSMCTITPGTDLTALVQKTKLIIWDEAPMMNRFCFEALDRSLRHIMGYEENPIPFGGKVIVLGGDFRQILPVVPKGSREDIVYSSINSSQLWHHCMVLRLTKNMRLTVGQSVSDVSAHEIKEFSEWILKVGDGELGEEVDGETLIDIHHDLLIHNSGDHVASIVESTYPSILNNYGSSSFFEERAILAPTNSIVEGVNDYVMSMIPGEERMYLSSDSVCKTFATNGNQNEIYPVDFLNTIKCSGIPNHVLKLKVGVPVMLIRNMDQSSGLCNGTRLIVTQLGDHIIEAKILSGNNIGTKVLIPRMKLSPSDSRLPFKFQRRQFPLIVCFAMTINKSQGQTLSHVGLYLPRPVFSHGQFYVAISIVKSRKGLKILCCDSNGNIMSKTNNVVYKEVFQHLK